MKTMKTPNPDHPIRNSLKHLALGVAAAAAFFTSGPSASADTVEDWLTEDTVSWSSDRTVTRYMNVGWWGGTVKWSVLNQTAGTITVPNVGIIIGQAASLPCAWNMSGSAALVTDTQTFAIGNAGGANGHTWSLTDTATATTGALSFNNSAGRLLLAGAATVSASNLTIAGTNYISFATGCTATLTVANKSFSDYQAYVTAGHIRVDGVVQTDFSQFQVTGEGDHTLSLTVSSSPYDTWANGTFANAFTDKAATSDPDGDGQANQQEFAFGLDPTTGSSVNPITQQLAGGVFKYTRTKDSGLIYKVYYSTNLSGWTWDEFATQTPAAAVAGVETVTVTLAAAAPLDGKLFVRVEASPAP